jgi:hypothetical protein
LDYNLFALTGLAYKKVCDMKSLSLLLLAAAVTPAFGITQAAKPGLSYDRVAVGYTSNDSLKGYDLTASALIGNSLIVSGLYQDVTGKGDLSGVTGRITGFGLAYKFNVGPGDLAIGYQYSQGQLGAYDGFAIAEIKGFGLNYRQAINETFEFSVGYARVSTALGALAVVGGNVAGGVASEASNVFNVAARVNFNKNLNAEISYAFQNKNAGSNTLGISLGYNF